MELKYGKRLKRRHKSFLVSQGYNPNDYLIVKDTTVIMEFVNRVTGKMLIFRY